MKITSNFSLTGEDLLKGFYFSRFLSKEVEIIMVQKIFGALEWIYHTNDSLEATFKSQNFMW